MLELPLTLARLLERHPEKIETIENETDTGDGYWLYLQPGWCGDDLGCHTIHEDTVKDILYQYAHYVQPCNCSECLRAAGLDGKQRLSEKDADAARKAQEAWQEELKSLQILWDMQEETRLHHQYEALLPERERAYADTVDRLRRYK